VIEHLKTALKKDRLKTSSVEMTSLGLVELTRKKTSLPVDDLMLEPCTECMGGHVVSAKQTAFMLRDDLIDYTLKNKSANVFVARINPVIFAEICENNFMSRELDGVWKNKKIYFVADENLKRSEFDFSCDCEIPPLSKMLE
ncbi:MAG: ribonuclease E/G, partial [Clostridia bacterium]|nr:ribonuclease E/G [Clostridia bacterium]